ncbi:uncharacterized protein LOC108870724 [Brassica rapa]|uniref:uncharacterized protein LOC108870724 n=1 Tax=Brassica campestris TaxID=3711 RepID=UPI000871D44F|nr:uncharacterized protein LOC108870724 [Brassica rapa]XP_033140332.1 uncharacterized protein LOC108870724 [Brassica rapa]
MSPPFRPEGLLIGPGRFISNPSSKSSPLCLGSRSTGLISRLFFEDGFSCFEALLLFLWSLRPRLHSLPNTQASAAKIRMAARTMNAVPNEPLEPEDEGGAYEKDDEEEEDDDGYTIRGCWNCCG